MKLKLNRPEKKILLSIPYDLVSTRIETLTPVLTELTESASGNTDFKQLFIDLEGAKMVDSAGLNFLVSIHKILSNEDCDVFLVTSDTNLLRTFKFSRIDQYMKVINNIDSLT